MVALHSIYQDHWTTALNTFRDPARRSWILVNSTSIFETWICCAFARAFKAKHGGPISMVMRETQVPIAWMYREDIDRIVAVEDARLFSITSRLHGLGSFDIDQPIVANTYWQGLGNDWHAYGELFAYPGRGGVSYADLTRLMLRLDWEAELAPWSIPLDWRIQAALHAKAQGVDPGNSVILFPDNNSSPALPDAFWQDLADALMREGRKVFTNMAGNNLGRRAAPLPGTHPILCDLTNVIPLVETAGRAISMNNGLSAMLVGLGIDATLTNLIRVPAPGQDHKVGSIQVKHPIAVQTHRHLGAARGPLQEYVVDLAVSDHRDLIEGIARQDAALMLGL